MTSEKFRVTLPPDESEFIRKIASKSGLEFTDVCKVLLIAAIAAVKDDGGRMELPPKFSVESSEYFRLSEKPSKK